MTVQDTDMIKIRNIMDHMVVFKDEETHRRIVFQPYEEKKISADILRRLNYSHGGGVLLRNYLCVENDELAREFGVSPDTIEYKWTRKDIDNCLLNESLDCLLDALDFGPEGIKDMIVQRAADLQLNDIAKRNAITEKTGSDINSIINLKKQYNEALNRTDEYNEENVTSRRRRVRGEETSGRRVKQN